MQKFTKITTGFVTQSYEKNTDGKFICTEQAFIAGDQIDYEDTEGNAITPPEHDYQPFEMTLLSGAEIAAGIEDVLSSIDVGGEQSRQFAEEIEMLKKILKVPGCSINQPKTNSHSFLEAQLLEACKVITSYTTELLYRMDNQVNLEDIKELQQVRAVIANYRSIEVWQSEMTLQEQSPDFPPKAILLSLLAENGQLWIRPQGYGEKCTLDGEGSPIGLEIWQGRLRLIVFSDINSEDPQIIDLENARETNRDD